MRVSEEEKQKTHRRIVEGATRLVRERGIEGTSVSDVMSDAGLTNGGFYRHFETREALLVAAIEAVMAGGGYYSPAIESEVRKKGR